MKASKKLRQRKRRAVIREKEKRRHEASGDKHFAAAMKTDLKKGLKGILKNTVKGVPHCEWNGTEFVPTRPKSSPRVDANVSVMHAAHKSFGIDWRGSRRDIHRPRVVSSITDSGCQTCSAGVDVLEQLGVPISYLVPTSHRIVGITESLLDIAGSVLLRIEVAGRITRQMVHVSSNTRGLYLSETALIELGIVSKNFPSPPVEKTDAAATDGHSKAAPSLLTRSGADIGIVRVSTLPLHQHAPMKV